MEEKSSFPRVKKSSLPNLIYIIRSNHITIDSFRFVRVLGKGAYGIVWLVEHKQTKDIYAMKIVDAEDAVIF